MATSPRPLPPDARMHRNVSIREVGWRRTFGTLGVPAYRTMWYGMVAGFVAMQLNIVARGYLAYEITGSATALGVVSLAWGIPMIVLSLFGGVVADRAQKRSVLLLTQTSMVGLSLITAVLVHAGLIEIWHLFVIGLGQGAVFAFNMPSRQAIIPELVGHDKLMNAIALNNAGMNVSRVLGPALAGILISIPFIGMTGAFYFMTALYVIAVWSIWRLPEGKISTRARQPMVTELKSGFVYIRKTPTLMVLIGLAFIPILFGMPYQMLMPVFASDVFHVKEVGLGLLFASVGVGALIGSLFIASFSDMSNRGRVQSLTGIGFGLTLIWFAASSSFFMAMIAVAALGLVSSAYMSLNNSMIMEHTNEEYYGRVMSIFMMTFSLMPLSAMPMGVLADTIGAPITVGVSGAIVAIFVVAMVLFVPAYRRIDSKPTVPVGADVAG